MQGQLSFVVKHPHPILYVLFILFTWFGNVNLYAFTDVNPHDVVTKTKSSKFSPAKLNKLESEMMRLINGHRKAVGRVPLQADAFVQKMTKAHNSSMNQKMIEYSHEGYNQRVRDIANYFVYASFTYESIFLSTREIESIQDVRSVFAAWMKLERYRKHIEGPSNTCGLAIDGAFITFITTNA